jgi:two-component system OmpR family sensor kinase
LAASLLLAVLLLLGVLLVNSVGSSELRQVDQQLKNSLPVARTLDSTTTPTFPPHPKSSKTFAADRFSAFYIAAITNGHRSVVSTPPDANGAAPLTPRATTTPRHAIKITTVGSVAGSRQWRAVLLKLPNSKTEVLVAVSLSQIDTTMGFLRLSMLFAGLIVLAVMVATGFWIARLGLRPIAEVTEVADAIAAGDRTRRVTRAQRRTEAGKLATAFNLMLDEQHALEARLRQFIADASHELRTPVSVILGITELWRQGELRNGEERDEAIHRIGLSGNQMGKLVEELLLLARLDEGRPMDVEPVDLERVVHEVVADALTTDPLRTVTVSVGNNVVVQGDAFRLRQVVSNLVNNALRYTPADSAIEVRLTTNGDTAMLDVDDSGPGMNEEESRHAFDRFWQADASRSRSGAGLGLPIVRGIVTAHGGSVTLESHSLTGTHVRVTIPLGDTRSNAHGVNPVGPI